MAKISKPQLFIIESLGFDDEAAGRQEGEILSRMLRLSGRKGTRYVYIRTVAELEAVLDMFDASGCRYLHISCHADTKGMETTLEDVPYTKLARLLKGRLEGRRVFVSGCEMANDTLAGLLLNGTGCFSLVGPARAIRFDDSAAFWVAFYHLMFKADARRMQHSTLERHVRELSQLFGEPIRYYRRDPDSEAGFRLIPAGRKRLTM